jgi:hypothetical protein
MRNEFPLAHFCTLARAHIDVSGNRLGDLGIATIGASLCAMQSDTTSMLAPPVLESLNLSDNMTSDQVYAYNSAIGSTLELSPHTDCKLCCVL